VSDFLGRQIFRSADGTYRNVSFRYPDAHNDALKDVSFKIGKGQLCVCPPSSVMSET
jgi:hypothetical protein